MWELKRTPVFNAWFSGLSDIRTRSVVTRRLTRVADGVFGDVKAVGEGVSELRIDYGPGLRIYFVRRGETLIVLLCAGDKGTQARDIARAKVLAREV